ncbi:hypothetical protein KJ682_06165 [bacterium]|nr:hypothetical protein [bacterium]
MISIAFGLRFVQALAAGAVLLMGVGGTFAQGPGDYVILVNNDLGMHCMNKDHSVLSILPPFNTLNAQVIQRGDPTRLPRIMTAGGTLEYSIPGNTYSAGKTDFWDHAQDLFGVPIPTDVGLTGKGLTGTFDPAGDFFIAEGIPVTPFTDAAPTVEDPYQLALVTLRSDGGQVLATARPVLPVSTEINCVTSRCHSSEQDILDGHEREGGFNPADQPILCASCHGSPPLTGPAPGSAGYFSRRIHEKHNFLDEVLPGIQGCNMCHPGPNTQCLRGTMANDHGMVCQDCHGTMRTMHTSIENGRIPWLEEPACRTCHTSTYGEPQGVLYRNARGHGGVMCTGCHNSPHAIFPSREERDNQVMVDLQGHAGTLSECSVCHGYTPSGAGPHGYRPVSAVEQEIFSGAAGLRVYPAPFQSGSNCTIMAASPRPSEGRLLVFDVRGRTVVLLRGEDGGDGMARITWNGRDAAGHDVASGMYFMRWEDGRTSAAGKVLVVN